MDKRLLDVADFARLARIEQLSEPLPPQPPPTFVIDGKDYEYVGPWDPNGYNELRERERHELMTRPLVYLIYSNAHVRAHYTEYLWQIEDESKSAG